MAEQNDDDSDDDLSKQLIGALQGTQLEWSTIVAEGHGSTKKKQCLLCNHQYTGGPALIRNHLDAKLKSRQIGGSKPKVNQLHRHKDVLAELHKRNQEEAQKDEVRRKREDSCGGKAAGGSKSGPLDAHSKRPSDDEVDAAWMRVIVKKALPLDLADDPEFRRALKKTCRAGQAYIDPKTQDVKLPRRKKLTQKVLPALDEKLEKKIRKKVEGLLQQCGCTVLSDGWTSIASRPIINALLSTPAGTRFLEALDTSGDTKDAQYIADFICRTIEAVGPENVVAVCMDGACKSSFLLIQAQHPHVQCFICPTHSLDNFLKNVGSDKEMIGVQGEGQYPWDEDVFHQPLSQTWEVIKFITNHQKPLARYRQIAAADETWGEGGKPAGGTELLKYGETRFASRFIMGQRLVNMQTVVTQLVADAVYNTWLSKQKASVKQAGAAVKEIV